LAFDALIITFCCCRTIPFEKYWTPREDEALSSCDEDLTDLISYSAELPLSLNQQPTGNVKQKPVPMEATGKQLESPHQRRKSRPSVGVPPNFHGFGKNNENKQLHSTASSPKDVGLQDVEWIPRSKTQSWAHVLVAQDMKSAAGSPYIRSNTLPSKTQQFMLPGIVSHTSSTATKKYALEQGDSPQPSPRADLNSPSKPPVPALASLPHLDDIRINRSTSLTQDADLPQFKSTPLVRGYSVPAQSSHRRKSSVQRRSNSRPAGNLQSESPSRARTSMSERDSQYRYQL